MRRTMMFLTLVLGAVPASSRPPVETPRLLSNGWHYGEAGNYCMAIRAMPDGTRLSMRLAKWKDMSDSLMLWKAALPPLFSNDAEEDAGAALDYHVSVAIDGRAVPRGSHVGMLADFDGRPGPTWRIGIAQQPFIAALAKGKALEIRRGGKAIARLPIAGSAGMAKAMAACVRKPPSF